VPAFRGHGPASWRSAPPRPGDQAFRSSAFYTAAGSASAAEPAAGSAAFFALAFFGLSPASPLTGDSAAGLSLPTPAFLAALATESAATISRWRATSANLLFFSTP
jgi:hypothetical protein